MIGIIDEFNGEFGYILCNDELIEFSKDDISNDQELNVGDTVEFRLEVKFYDIKIARHINKVEGVVDEEF